METVWQQCANKQFDSAAHCSRPTPQGQRKGRHSLLWWTPWNDNKPTHSYLVLVSLLFWITTWLFAQWQPPTKSRCYSQVNKLTKRCKTKETKSIKNIRIGVRGTQKNKTNMCAYLSYLWIKSGGTQGKAKTYPIRQWDSSILSIESQSQLIRQATTLPFRWPSLNAPFLPNKSGPPASGVPPSPIKVETNE